MPYMIVKDGDTYHVHKKGPDGQPGKMMSDKPMTEDEAKKYMTALDIAMHKEGKSLLDGIAEGFKKMVTILGFGDDDIAEGDKEKLAAPPGKDEPKSEGKLPVGDVTHLEDAITALSPGGFRGHPVQLTPEKRKEAIAEIESKINSMSMPEEKKAHLRERLAAVKEIEWTGFKVINDGKSWIATWSNNFEDRTGEIFSEKSIQRYIDRVYAGDVPFPELWWRHYPVAIGQAKWLGLVDHFAIAGGDFNDKGYTKTLIPQLAQKENGKMSHGYLYYRSNKVNGVYNDFNTFEITAGLPPHRAANPYTNFEIVGVKDMPLSEKQLEEIRGSLGDQADEYIDALKKKSKELEEQGVGFKGDTVDGLKSEIKSLTDTVSKLVGVVEQLQAGQKTLTDNQNGTTEFLKVQFGNKEFASASDKTKVDETDPKVDKLKEKMDKPAEEATEVKSIKMLFPWLEEAGEGQN